MSTCSVQRPIGLSAGDSASPADTDSVRMITLKLKFDTNAKKGEFVSQVLVSPPNMSRSVCFCDELIYFVFVSFRCCSV